MYNEEEMTCEKCIYFTPDYTNAEARDLFRNAFRGAYPEQRMKQVRDTTKKGNCTKEIIKYPRNRGDKACQYGRIIREREQNKNNPNMAY